MRRPMRRGRPMRRPMRGSEMRTMRRSAMRRSAMRTLWLHLLRLFGTLLDVVSDGLGLRLLTGMRVGAVRHELAQAALQAVPLN
jgi:hypothetical protein